MNKKSQVFSHLLSRRCGHVHWVTWRHDGWKTIFLFFSHFSVSKCFFKFTWKYVCTFWPWAEDCVCFLSHQMKLNERILLGRLLFHSIWLHSFTQQIFWLVHLQQSQNTASHDKKELRNSTQNEERLSDALNSRKFDKWKKEHNEKSPESAFDIYKIFYSAMFGRVKSARRWSVECEFIQQQQHATYIWCSRLGKLRKRARKEGSMKNMLFVAVVDLDWSELCSNAVAGYELCSAVLCSFFFPFFHGSRYLYGPHINNSLSL